MLVKVIKSGLFAEDCRTVHALTAGSEKEFSKVFANRLIEAGYAQLPEELKDNGPSEEELAAIVAQVEKARLDNKTESNEADLESKDRKSLLELATSLEIQFPKNISNDKLISLIKEAKK